MLELLPARFQGPPKMDVIFFLAFVFFSSFFSGSSASSKRLLKKTLFLWFFLHTLLKHLVASCSNKEVKPKLPKKRCTFFSGNLCFDQKQLSKALILHHPLKTVHQKSPQTPIFKGSKKVAKLLTLPWPSYWPQNGQNVAKLLTLQHIYIYIYIYTSHFSIITSIF